MFRGCFEEDLDVLRAEVARLRERLDFDEGGSDRIDELEQALQFSKHALENALKLNGTLLEFLRDLSSNWDCDGSYSHHHSRCRACEARKLLEESGFSTR